MFIENLTFVIFTFNEEKRLENVIKNFINFGKILVVDNFSSDKTVEIAEKYGCSILMNKNSGWVEDEKTVARVKESVTTDWIYWAFADEMIELNVINAIRNEINSGLYDIINIYRKNYYYGHFCNNTLMSPLNRVFKKGAIDFTGNTIHHFGKTMVAEMRIKYLPKSLYVHHFMSYTAASYLNSINRYTDIEVSNSTSNSFMLFLRLSRFFFGQFFIRGGYKSGKIGFYLILMEVMYKLVNEMKSFERSIYLDANIIENMHDKIRHKIIDEL